MTYALFGELPMRRRTSRDQRDWLTVYRQAEAEAELAADAVRVASAAYLAVPAKVRNLVGEADAYAEADRAYDRARFAFQRASREIVDGVRAIAGIARHMQLAQDSAGRML